MDVLASRPEVIAFVNSVAEEQGLQKYDITDVKTNEKGEGYLGQIFMVTLKDKTSDKNLNLVIKSAFSDEKIRRSVPIRKSFLNEIYFYTQVEREFRKIETDHGISHTDFFPKCYKVTSEIQKETLCLDNLKELKFEIFDKKKLLDDEHISLIFQIYGRFHAYMFAFKDQKAEEYGQTVGKMYNIYEEFVNNPSGGFNTYLKSFNVLVEKYLTPGDDDEIISKYKKYLGDGIVNKFHKSVTELDEYSTLLHGDCWSNNMLFKYETKNGNKKPIDMRLIDMQLVKVGSPACDLGYCFYSGASKALFDNLDKYLKIYYESFSTLLKNLGSDPDKVFPFHVLQAHWKKYAPFVLTMSLMILKIKCTNAEDLLDLTDNREDNYDEHSIANMKFNEDEYKKRVKELLCHLSEIDAL